jgi:hypothetical protein
VKARLFSTLALFVIFLVPLDAFEENPSSDVAFVTIPKAGTHLLQKLANYLIGEKREYSLFHTDVFLHSEDLLEKYPKRILLIRDPRDVSVSWIHFVEGGISGKIANFIAANLILLSKEKKEIWMHLPFHKKLLYVIRGSSSRTREANVDPSLIYYPLSAYEDAVTLAKRPNTLICKFENLVGPRGGGKEEAQREEIMKIATFLGIRISFERLQYIADHLFGGTVTFYKGKIGSWKKAFSREHKKLFKKRRNHLLTTFGYEKDDRW